MQPQKRMALLQERALAVKHLMLSLVCPCLEVHQPRLFPFARLSGLPEADVTMTQHKLELPNPVQIREEINAAIPETLPVRRAGRER